VNALPVCSCCLPSLQASKREVVISLLGLGMAGRYLRHPRVSGLAVVLDLDDLSIVTAMTIEESPGATYQLLSGVAGAPGGHPAMELAPAF
jgi:hypothetical protein